MIDIMLRKTAKGPQASRVLLPKIGNRREAEIGRWGAGCYCREWVRHKGMAEDGQLFIDSRFKGRLKNVAVGRNTLESP